MPCDYKEYHPKWKLISKLIRVNRAGNQCEWCGVKNHAVGIRVKGKFIPTAGWVAKYVTLGTKAELKY